MVPRKQLHLTPLVSIIIVTYNSDQYIGDCLDSLKKLKYKPFEVIVVDNNSTDKTRKVLSNQKWIKCILSDKNNGYALGCNMAFSASNGEYIFVLNPDTTVDPEFLNSLVLNLNDKEVSVVQPAIYLLKDKSRLNLTGKVTHFLGFDWIRDYRKKDLPSRGDISSFSGAGSLIRRSTIEKIGFYDEFYFMYYEDTDLSWRIRLQNQKIIFEPKSIIYHDYKYIPVESYQPLKQKLYYIERNRLITIYKNYSVKTIILIFPTLLLIELGMILLSIFQGWFGEKLKGYFSIIKNHDELSKHRLITQRNRKASDKDIAKELVSTISFTEYEKLPVKLFINPLLMIYWQFVLLFI